MECRLRSMLCFVCLYLGGYQRHDIAWEVSRPRLYLLYINLFKMFCTLLSVLNLFLFSLDRWFYSTKICNVKKGLLITWYCFSWIHAKTIHAFFIIIKHLVSVGEKTAGQKCGFVAIEMWDQLICEFTWTCSSVYRAMPLQERQQENNPCSSECREYGNSFLPTACLTF